VLSPAGDVAVISNAWPALIAPLWMGAPLIRATGIGSPVNWDSSIQGLIGKNGAIDRYNFAAAHENPIADGDPVDGHILKAAVGITMRLVGCTIPKQTKIFSARATAKSSRTLRPEYISATIAPASGRPRASATTIDIRAIASTPIRPARKSGPWRYASPRR
jgi:hypothetical protein